MSRILIVDDDPGLRTLLRRLLEGEGYAVDTARSGEEALEMLRSAVPDLMIVDVQMAGLSGIETCQQTKALAPDLPVIVMTGCGTTDTAIDAMRSGAFEYVVKPFRSPELQALVQRALSSSMLLAIHEDLPVWSARDDSRMAGMSPGMLDVYKRIGQVANSAVTVLIRGESGTGKEMVARSIWRHGSRSTGPFVAVNCSALPEPLLESELFGHEKGAFTGAVARKIGRFEQADKGTLLLDEVGDLSQATQIKLLRVLQERSLERLGGAETIRLDVRILAATHRDLEQLVREGTFRRDLYYRLNVVTITVPPLRERREDILSLVGTFLNRHGASLGRAGTRISAEALERLQACDWPGNVRQLEHCLEQAMILSTTGLILPEHLHLDRPGGEISSKIEGGRALLRELAQEHLRLTPGSAYQRFMGQLERVLVAEAMEQTKGTLAAAARLLGISRPTLRDRLRLLSLSERDSVPEGPHEDG